VGDHPRRQPRRLLEIALGARRDGRQHEPFGGLAAHEHPQARFQLGLHHEVSVGARALLRERHAAGNDAHPVRRLGLGRERGDHRVAGLMNGDPPLLLDVKLRFARIAEHDLVECLREVRGRDARGRQIGFFDVNDSNFLIAYIWARPYT
jgi:hypothetical protein